MGEGGRERGRGREGGSEGVRGREERGEEAAREERERERERDKRERGERGRKEGGGYIGRRRRIGGCNSNLGVLCGCMHVYEEGLGVDQQLCGEAGTWVRAVMPLNTQKQNAAIAHRNEYPNLFHFI